MKLIPIATIRSAKRGDSTAVSEIILSFHTYITNRCVYKYQDKKGQTHMELDEDLQQIATLALLSAISGFEFLEMDVFDSEDACIQANQLRFIKYCTVSISHAIGNAHDERTALAARECFLSDTQVDELTVTIPEIEEAFYAESLDAQYIDEIEMKSIYILWLIPKIFLYREFFPLLWDMAKRKGWGKVILCPTPFFLPYPAQYWPNVAK